MECLTQNLILQHLPSHKINSRGWRTFNAVCCHHRGHNPDGRHRGNLLCEGTITTYNCYNCNFSVKFDEQIITHKAQSLMQWLGIPEDQISFLKLQLYKNRIEGIEPASVQTTERTTQFSEQPMPEEARPISYWLEQNTIPDDLLVVLDNMLNTRGSAVTSAYEYYWSPATKWNLNQRIIIPFFYQNLIVGWTARWAWGPVPSGVPRYRNSDIPANYIFNWDTLAKNRKICLVHEGPFDAIATEGVAVLGSKLSSEQIFELEKWPCEKIIVPDRQRKNQNMIDQALALDWAVSFPDWEADVKDASDAAKKYGRLYTLRSIISSKTNNKLEIGIKRQMFAH